jgi:hypothetical protein
MKMHPRLAQHKTSHGKAPLFATLVGAGVRVRINGFKGNLVAITPKLDSPFHVAEYTLEHNLRDFSTNVDGSD